MKVAALLRGVNVGGNKIVPMAELREMLEGMGFSGVRTLLQSGNAVFEGSEIESTELEARLEVATRERFGFDVTYMVRTVAEWERVVAENPFPDVAQESPAKLLATFLKGEPAPGGLESLCAALAGPEQFVGIGRTLYVHFPDGIGISKFSPNLIERKLGVAGTGRNWNTVLKIAALLQPSA